MEMLQAEGYEVRLCGRKARVQQGNLVKYLFPNQLKELALFGGSLADVKMLDPMAL